MTNSKKESKKAQAHAAHASSHGKDNVVTEFGQQLDKENFSGAGSVILAMPMMRHCMRIWLPFWSLK